MLEKNYAFSVKSPLTNYDALQDEHASFYFNGYGVKRHLKKLKKAIEMGPRSKQYKQYSDMLTNKIKQLDEQAQSVKVKIKPYQQSLKPASLYKLHKLQFFLDESKQKESSLKAKEELKDARSAQKLPNLSKKKQSAAQKPRERSEIYLQSDQQINKQKKTFSTGGTFQPQQFNSKQTSTSITSKGGRLGMNFNRDRKDRSVQMKKGRGHEGPKEVQHQEFMLFLKKRQAEIEHSKPFKTEEKEALVLESINEL